MRSPIDLFTILSLIHARGILALTLPYTYDDKRMPLVDALVPAPADKPDARPWHGLPGFEGAHPNPWFVAADGEFFCPRCVIEIMAKGRDYWDLRFEGEPGFADTAPAWRIIGLQPPTHDHVLDCAHCGDASH